MELLNDCPECGKQLSRSRKYCACGWKTVIINEKNMDDRYCQYQTAQGRCKEIATVCWYVALSETYKY